MALDEKLYANQFERNIVGSAIKSISNKWTFYILKDLFLGKKRFSQFQENRPNLDNKSSLSKIVMIWHNFFLSDIPSSTDFRLNTHVKHFVVPI